MAAQKDGGLVARRTNHEMRALNFQPKFKEERGSPRLNQLTTASGFHQLYLCDEASRRTHRMGFGELPGW